MSESDAPKVEVSGDNGHQSRWGIGRLLFRQDGPKESLNAKVAAYVFGIFILIATTYSLVSGVTGSDSVEKRKPIEFNGAVMPSREINVPIAGSAPAPARWGKGKRAPEVFGGPQIVKRSQSLKIPPGTFIKAQFVTGASNGPAKAVLLEDFSVDGETLLEQGLVLIGQGSSGDDRLTVQFSKLVFKDGTFQQIHAQACDITDQTVGVRGEKANKYAAMLAAGAGLNFIGGLTQGLEQQQAVVYGVTAPSATLRNAALNGASTAALDQGTAILNSWKQQKSIIQVKSGQEFYILFDGE